MYTHVKGGEGRRNCARVMVVGGVFARELELVIGVVVVFFFLGKGGRKGGVCLWLFSEVMVWRSL